MNKAYSLTRQAVVVTVLAIHFLNGPRNFFDSRPAMVLS